LRAGKVEQTESVVVCLILRWQVDPVHRGLDVVSREEAGRVSFCRR
jgi:hypothetical protein